LDCDNNEAIQWAETEIGKDILDSTPCVLTKKGRHYYFRIGENDIVPSWSRRDNGDGGVAFDLRAEGAGVICPPSIHQSGIVYKWLRSPDDGYQPLPDVLRKAAGAPGAPEGGEPPKGVKARKQRSGKDEVETLAKLLESPADEGGRNDWLTKVCGHLAKQLDYRDGYLAGVKLANASLKAPLGDAEWKKTADSIWEAEATRSHLPPARFLPSELTESGMAHAFAARHSGDLWFVSGTWYVYEKKEGRFLDDEDAALRLTQKAVAEMRKEAIEREDKQAIAFIMKMASARGLKAVLTLSQIEPSLRANVAEFDSHPDLLNVRNGVLVLESGELKKHSPDWKFTRVAGVEWHEGEKCARWDEHLLTVFGGDKELVEFMQRWAGRSLSGVSPSDGCRILMPYGTGANGKTVTVETLATMLGEYARSTDFNTWCASKDGSGGGSQQRQDLVDLAGVRLVTATESGYHHSLDEALLKMYTGGERVSPRGMYAKRSKVYRPHFSLLLSTNHLPRLEGSDKGFWRRFLKVGFAHEIPEPDQDHHLLAKLRLELPGILAWAQRGYAEWKTRGLDAPTSVLMETAQYRLDIDWIGQFVEEHLIERRDSCAPMKSVYARYQGWCNECGINRALTFQQFSARLSEHHLERGEDPTTRVASLMGVELQDVRANRNGREAWMA